MEARLARFIARQFCCFDIVLTVVKNSLWRYLWTFILATRLVPLWVFIWRNFHPGKRDLAFFKQDLNNRASPLIRVNLFFMNLQYILIFFLQFWNSYWNTFQSITPTCATLRAGILQRNGLSPIKYTLWICYLISNIMDLLKENKKWSISLVILCNLHQNGFGEMLPLCFIAVIWILTFQWIYIKLTSPSQKPNRTCHQITFGHWNLSSKMSKYSMDCYFQKICM